MLDEAHDSPMPLPRPYRYPLLLLPLTERQLRLEDGNASRVVLETHGDRFLLTSPFLQQDLQLPDQSMNEGLFDLLLDYAGDEWTKIHSSRRGNR